MLFGGLAARFARVPAVVSAVSGLGFVFVAKGVKAIVRRWLVGGLYRLALGHHNQQVIFQNRDDMPLPRKVCNFVKAKISIIRGSGVDLTQYCAMPFQPVYR